MPARDRKLERRRGKTKYWLKWLIRLGYISRGVVYIMIGVLSIQAVSGLGGRETGPRGALLELLGQPLGLIPLGVIAAGLLSYGCWRVIVAFADLENNGRSLTGIVQRIGSTISGLLYIALFLVAVQLMAGLKGGGGGKGPQYWTALVFAEPLGRWAVGITGIITIIVGFYNFYKAYSTNFQTELNSEKMSRAEQKWAVRVGLLGFAAQGVVLCLIGAFLTEAALRYDPREAGGVAKALQTLSHQPYGPWLLGIVAIGFISSGAYSLVLARYRKI